LRNRKLVEEIPTEQSLKFRRFVPKLGCNGIFIAGKMAVAGGAALAAGTGWTGAGTGRQIANTLAAGAGTELATEIAIMGISGIVGTVAVYALGGAVLA
jgi:hypothetical protein